jgi:PKD repeat protein
MKRVLLCSILCLVFSGTIFAQLAENPFIYDSVNDQLQSCYGIASRNAAYCNSVSDFNDRQICAGLATSSQDPCRSMTDRNLQLACYGMAFAPDFPSNCRDITVPGLQDFCYSVSSWGSWANCSGVSNAADSALCKALTYRDSSYCATITSVADRQFCYGVSSHDSSYCGALPPSTPSTSAGGPYTVNEGGSVAVTAAGAGAGASYAWDLDNDGVFETPGQSATFSALDLDGPGSRTIGVRATAGDGQTVTAQTTVNIVNVAPTATFNAPSSASPGGAVPLSLTASNDVAADLPTLQYAFDCGSGFGPFSGSSTASCTAPNSNTLTVRGQVRDKDGGASQYTATVATAAPTVSPDPFSPPAHNDSTFVVDRGLGLDTGCSSSGDRSLQIILPVGRVVGDWKALRANGLLARTAVLKMPAYDIAFSGGNGVNPERDRVYFNGNLVPTEFLTGDTGSWRMNTFLIPIDWVHFPADPFLHDPPTALVPEANVIQIYIDTGNTKTFSCTSIDWASLSIQVARPVLLIHGFNSNGGIWHELWTNEYNNQYKKGQLDLLGLPARTISVGKVASISDNSALIHYEVDKLRRLWGVDQLNIVAHSKGGLDSRDFIEHNNSVATLLQIGTPNRGTTLGSIGHAIEFILNRFGIWGDLVDFLAPAISQLSLERMAIYNQFHGYNPRTRYVSLAGEYRFDGFFSFIPNNFFTALYLGANDLVVPAWSVRGLNYAEHLTYKSHGGNHQARHTAESKSIDIYNMLAPYLKVYGNPGIATATELSPLMGTALTKSVSEQDQTAPDLTTIKTSADTIAQGQTATHTMYVDGTQPVGLILAYGTGELNLQLISPSGARIDPIMAETDPNIHYEPLLDEDGLKIQMYVVNAPEVGTWTLEVSAPSVVNPSGQEPYALTGVLTESPIEFEATTDRSAYHRGDPIILHARLGNAGRPITAASVTAQVRQGNQSPISLTLADDGNGDDPIARDGIYSGRFTGTSLPGEYGVLVSATGPAATPFNREKFLLTTVSASTSRLNGTFSDTGDDTDSDGLFNDLVVEVGMDVTETRSYRMLGELADANGTLIATATALANLNAGAGTVSLRFDGASIYKHGADGPYLLRVVRVAEDDGSAILPLDERLNAYTTASYDHRQFQHPALAGLDQSVTTDEDTPVDITLGADSATPATLSFSVVNAPSHGVLTGTAPHLTYTPEANFNGADAFTFQVGNGTTDSELATVIITVNPVNDPPAVAPVADSVMDEGTASSVAVSASDLDGDDLKLTLTGLPAFATLADKGDGTGTIVLAPGFDAAGTYRGVVTASDGTSSATTTFTLTVNNVNRPPVANAGGPYIAAEGVRVTLDASRSADPDTEGSITRYEWDLDNDGVYGDATGATVTAVFGDQGTYPVGLRVTDDQGARATATTQVAVRNVPPTASFSAPATTEEGRGILLGLSNAQDVAADLPTLQYAFDCGAGAGYGAFGAASSATCAALDNPSQVVKGAVRDKDGGVTEYISTVSVVNVAPTVGAISGPTGPSPVNTAIAVNATFNDPGALDTHTAVWDWNDGTTSAGTVLETGAPKSVSGTHVYTVAGVYTVKLTVTDKDGGAGTALYQYVVIYDRDGGFVTGGGWLNSPAGAYPADPGVLGRANFGFVSKYAPGATVPTGQTQFQFRAANLSFHSDTYEWLVVAGARAQYKGTGEINGKGGYGFLLTAIDGQINGGGGIDKLRLKIWDKASGGVVYDNQIGSSDDAAPTTSIQEGSIVIHPR